MSEEQVDAEKTQKLITATGQQCLLFPQDIRDEQGCIRVIDEVVKAWGRIDILVNNASVMVSSSSHRATAYVVFILPLTTVQYDQTSITDITTEQFDRTMKTNIVSFHLSLMACRELPTDACAVRHVLADSGCCPAYPQGGLHHCDCLAG